MRLICFGDSICHGYGVAPEQAWTALLRARCDAAWPGVLEIIDAGVNGDTTTDGLRRMARDVEARRPDLLYIQFGLNDCWIGESSVAASVENVRRMVDRALACGVKAVIVADNHPVLFGEDLLLGGGLYPRRVRRHNAALREAFAVASSGVTFADLEQAFLQAAPEPARLHRLLQEDGLHLSPEGNMLYCERLFPLVREGTEALRKE